MAPPALRDAALSRTNHASQVLGQIEFGGPTPIAPVWRPLIAELRPLGVEGLDHGGTGGWTIGADPASRDGTEQTAATVESCADPRAEAVEALRWARELVTSGKATPAEIAICATSTGAWDDHFLLLSRQAGLPLCFSHGLPALASREGQACAALADALLNEPSPQRIRRLRRALDGGIGGAPPDPGSDGTCPPSRSTPESVERWRRAVARATGGAGIVDPQALLPVIPVLARGAVAAEEAGGLLPDARSRELWSHALRRAPVQALASSLGELRTPDPTEPGAAITWGPATHLAGAPRRFVRCLGMTTKSWPRPPRQDPLAPRSTSDASPAWGTVAARDRRDFAVIGAHATGGCVLSHSRRDGTGARLAPSPLLPRDVTIEVVLSSRIPRHAFSEADRLAARPDDALNETCIASATRCWRSWHRPQATAHDGWVSSDHPAVVRALDAVQSATSLRRMLSDPQGFVWENALGWRAGPIEERPLMLSGAEFGELVHEILRRAVDLLEVGGGLPSASADERRGAADAAAETVETEWPSARNVPPALLWRHVVEGAGALAADALVRDAFQPGSRSWTEVAFGAPAKAADSPRAGPWDPVVPVMIPGTSVRLRGRIDRVDLNGERRRARVSDYKTGVDRGTERLLPRIGADLQTALYAIAARQLLAIDEPVVARLVRLAPTGSTTTGFALDDEMTAEVAAIVLAGRERLAQGLAFPGADAGGRDDPFRLARPASYARYLATKRRAFGRTTAGDRDGGRA